MTLTADHAPSTRSPEEAEALIANLQRALDSNRRIGIAIGIVMTRRLVTDRAAFDLLRRTSQVTHRKLRDVAEDVILTGDLPAPPRIGRIPAP